MAADAQSLLDRLDAASRRLMGLAERGIDSGALQGRLTAARELVQEGRLGDGEAIADEVELAARRLAMGGSDSHRRTSRTLIRPPQGAAAPVGDALAAKDQTGDPAPAADAATQPEFAARVAAVLDGGLLEQALAQQSRKPDPRFEARMQKAQAEIFEKLAARIQSATDSLAPKIAEAIPDRLMETLHHELHRAIDLVEGRLQQTMREQIAQLAAALPTAQAAQPAEATIAATVAQAVADQVPRLLAAELPRQLAPLLPKEPVAPAAPAMSRDEIVDTVAKAVADEVPRQAAMLSAAVAHLPSAEDLQALVGQMRGELAELRARTEALAAAATAPADSNAEARLAAAVAAAVAEEVPRQAGALLREAVVNLPTTQDLKGIGESLRGELEWFVEKAAAEHGWVNLQDVQQTVRSTVAGGMIGKAGSEQATLARLEATLAEFVRQTQSQQEKLITALRQRHERSTTSLTHRLPLTSKHLPPAVAKVLGTPAGPVDSSMDAVELDLLAGHQIPTSVFRAVTAKPAEEAARPEAAQDASDVEPMLETGRTIRVADPVTSAERPRTKEPGEDSGLQPAGQTAESEVPGAGEMSGAQPTATGHDSGSRKTPKALNRIVSATPTVARPAPHTAADEDPTLVGRPAIDPEAPEPAAVRSLHLPISPDGDISLDGGASGTSSGGRIVLGTDLSSGVVQAGDEIIALDPETSSDLTGLSSGTRLHVQPPTDRINLLEAATGTQGQELPEHLLRDLVEQQVQRELAFSPAAATTQGATMRPVLIDPRIPEAAAAQAPAEAVDDQREDLRQELKQELRQELEQELNQEIARQVAAALAERPAAAPGVTRDDLLAAFRTAIEQSAARAATGSTSGGRRALDAGTFTDMLRDPGVQQELFAVLSLEIAGNPSALGALTGLRSFLRQEVQQAAATTGAFRNDGAGRDQPRHEPVPAFAGPTDDGRADVQQMDATLPAAQPAPMSRSGRPAVRDEPLHIA